MAIQPDGQGHVGAGREEQLQQGGCNVEQVLVQAATSNPDKGFPSQDALQGIWASLRMVSCPSVGLHN